MIVLTTSAMVAPGRFVALEAAGEVPDIWRMEGAIELTVGDVAVLGVRHWDVIVPLWANLATALSELRGVGAGSLQFPDQNVEVALTRTSDGVRVSVRGDGSGTEVVAGEPEFVQAVRARGAEFFDWAAGRFPQDRTPIAAGRRRLFQDPPDAVLTDGSWEARLDRRQVDVFRQAERAAGRRMTPPERERLILAVAGRPWDYADHLARVTGEWLK